MDKPATPIIVQGSQMPNGQNLWPKALTPTSLPKIIFILLSVVIVGELIWGAWYILKPTPLIGKIKNQAGFVTQKPTSATISLKTSQVELAVGDNLNVDIFINANGKPTTGTDLLIKYDPNFLSLTKTSFTKGSIYSEYLGQSVDNTKGFYRNSGLSPISSKKSTDGKFGTLSFKVLAAGNTKVTVDFKPGASNDSNVIDNKTSKDILDKVDNLEVNIK